MRGPMFWRRRRQGAEKSSHEAETQPALWDGAAVPVAQAPIAAVEQPISPSTSPTSAAEGAAPAEARRRPRRSRASAAAQPSAAGDAPAPPPRQRRQTPAPSREASRQDASRSTSLPYGVVIVPMGKQYTIGRLVKPEDPATANGSSGSRNGASWAPATRAASRGYPGGYRRRRGWRQTGPASPRAHGEKGGAQCVHRLVHFVVSILILG
jgi:hypothetical protein